MAKNNTKSRGASSKSFNDHLPKEIQNALGKSLDEQFNDTNTLLDRNQKELAEKQKQLEQVEQSAAESQKLRRDMDAITNRIKDDDDRIRELEDAHGPLDTEKIQRLKNERGRLNLIINPNGNNCHSYRRMQNKPTKYKKKLTNSCLTIEG